MRKRAYRAIGVKEIAVQTVLSELSEGPIWMGLDIGKAEVFGVLRDSAGQFQRPWRVRQPTEVGQLVERLALLARHRPLVVAVESTGTYGDPLRQALGDAGLQLERVSSKATSDYAEIFDGVPSQHDGKDAAMLAAIGKSRAWPHAAPGAWAGALEGEVQWLETQQEILQLWLGRLEALLARHWPEAPGILPLGSGTLLQ